MVLIRKKALRLGSVAVAMTLLFGLCACKGENGREDEKDLAFSKSTYMVERFTTLDVSVSGTESVAYSSSDESVFTVSADGMLTGIKAGEATLTATAGNANVSATVRVRPNTSYPVLKVSGEALKIPVGTSYPLNPVLVYKGETLPASFDYTADDGLTVRKGVLRATELGEFTCKISCVYAQDVFEKTVTVQSMTGDYYYFDENDITLYASDLFDEGLPTEFSLVSHTNISGTSRYFSSDNSIVTVDENGKITARSPGKATVTARIENVSESVSVTVRKQPYRLTEPVLFEYHASEVEYSAISDGAVVSASVDGVPTDCVTYDETSGKYIVSTAGLRVPVGEELHSLVLETQTGEYIQPFSVATMIVDDLAEFKLIQSKYFKGTQEGVAGSSDTAKYRDGYFVLNADINEGGSYFDFTMCPVGYTEDGHGCVSTDANRAWYGTIDGNGHVVYNVTAGYGGMFGQLPATSAIRNLAVVGAKASMDGAIYTGDGRIQHASFSSALSGKNNQANTGFLTRGLNGGTVENVYIEMAEMPALNRYGVLAFVVQNNTTLKNVVINVKACAQGQASDRHVFPGVNWGCNAANLFAYGAIRPDTFANDSNALPSISRSSYGNVKSAKELSEMAENVNGASIPHLTVVNGKLHFGAYAEA